MNHVFIGTGHNPHGPDLPLGFGMQLAQEPEAMDAFGKLTNAQKASLIRRIQSGSTGEEAQRLIADAVRELKSGGASSGGTGVIS